MIEYDRIPITLKYSSLENELVAHPDVKQALELAPQHGWLSALEQTYGKDSYPVRYAVASERCEFFSLLPLKPESTVALEIGTGVGQHTIPLAGLVKQLDVIEVRLLNTLFTRLRCEQEGVHNVRFFCGGDDCKLPFPDQSYDLVILNLVLEWCAADNREAPGLEGQSRLLSEIRRVLKPGGLLQLNTKNRYALSYLLGGPDEHSHNLRFGSALPRSLQRWLLRSRGQVAGGLLHSYNGLRKLLENHGLKVIKTYEAYPEMRFPKNFVDSSRPESLPRDARLGPSRKTHALMKLIPRRWRKHFTPGLFFVAERSSP